MAVQYKNAHFQEKHYESGQFLAVRFLGMLLFSWMSHMLF